MFIQMHYPIFAGMMDEVTTLDQASTKATIDMGYTGNTSFLESYAGILIMLFANPSLLEASNDSTPLTCQQAGVHIPKRMTPKEWIQEQGNDPCISHVLRMFQTKPHTSVKVPLKNSQDYELCSGINRISCWEAGCCTGRIKLAKGINQQCNSFFLPITECKPWGLAMMISDTWQLKGH